MNEEVVEETQKQLWEHLRELNRAIEEHQILGATFNRGDDWIDQAGVPRSRWWLIDQLYFCRSEIAFWKQHASEFKLKGDNDDM